MRNTITQKTFYWRGKNQHGEFVKGEQSAISSTLLKISLRRQKITPYKIQQKSVLSSIKQKINSKDITSFSRQFSVLLSAGITLIPALDMLARGHNKPSMQNLIYALKNTIEKGSSIAEALRKNSQYFDTLYCNLIAIGEQSGTLDHILDRIATYKEKTELLKRKIKKALLYPAMIMFVAILVTVAMLVFVVPQFTALFSSFGAQLPLPTRMIISLSDFLRQYGWIILGFFTLLFIILRWKIRRSPQLLQRAEQLLFKLPIIGNILVKGIIARFTRTLATTFAAGLPLTDALTAVSTATDNRIYAQATLQIREKIMAGLTLQQAISQTKLFPHLVVQMIAIGEQSGTLDTMLNKVATMFEEDVDHTVDNLSTLLEPFIMIFLGIVIGGLVIALYLPIFRLGSVV